jgi:hypothetical protein
MKLRPQDIEAADRFLHERDDSITEGGTGLDAERSMDGVPMDDDDLAAIISGELIDAVRFVDLEIGVERAEATKAYRGDPYGDEEAGRSSIVMRDVHDTVQGQLPDLLRILLNSERVCEYVANGPQDDPWVNVATSYAEFVVFRDNDGFMELYNVVKDALKYKVGIIKFWWDESEEVRTEHYTGINELGLFLLQQDGDIEFESVEPIASPNAGMANPTAGPAPGAPGTPMQPPATPPGATGAPNAPYPPSGPVGNSAQISPAAQQLQQSPMASSMGQALGQQQEQLYNVTIRRRITNGRIKLRALPPEEFIIDRRARSLQPYQFVLCGHRSMMTVSELVALGYPEEDVRPFVTSPELDTNIEYIERQPYARAVGSFDALNPATQRVLYVEGYVYVDADGDGIAELRKVCTMGPAYKVVHHEAVDHVPFADFQCDPEPHTFFGLSSADKTMDLQKINTHIMRNTLDSLAQSIHPRTTVVEGQVNVEDVLNNEVGGVVRQRAPGMVQTLDTPFVGQQALPVLDYMDGLREMRTGVSKTQLGLNAEDLQSTNAIASEAAISGSQGKIELIARTLANGMKKLFDGILHLIVQNQDRPRVIQLAGAWVPIDPRAWNADVKAKINVALGGGSQAQKLASIMAILGKQELILSTMGMNQPIVKPSQYAAALRKWAELSGWKNPDIFFSEVPADWTPPPPPPPPPDPRMLQVQNDHEYRMAQLQLDGQRLKLEAQKAHWEEERSRDKNTSEAALKAHQIGTTADTATANAKLQSATQIAVADINATQQGQNTEVAETANSDRQTMQHFADMHLDLARRQHESSEAAADREHEATQNAHDRATGLAQAAMKPQPESKPTKGKQK